MVVALESSALLLVKGDLLGCIVVCGRCSVSQQATQALVFQLFILSYVWRLKDDLYSESKKNSTDENEKQIVVICRSMFVVLFFVFK